MVKRKWVSLVAAAVLPVIAMVPAQAACKLQLIAAVDVELGPAGAVLLPVKVNGHDVWMVLQLSSGVAMVNRAVAEQLGLQFQDQRNLQTSSDHGMFYPQMTIVPSMLVGAVNFAGWNLYVQPPSQQPIPMFRGRPVLGPLSSQFVNAADMELDLAHRKLNLFKQTYACKGQQVYWGGQFTEVPLYADSSGLLIFPMEVDGKRVETSLNTRGRATVISEKVTSLFFGFDHNSPGTNHGPGGPGSSYRSMGLTAKGLEMKDVQVWLRDDMKSICVPTTSDRQSRAIGFDQCVSESPLQIGTDLLQRLHIYIAAREGRIYFTRVAEPAPVADAAPGAAVHDAPAAAGAAAPAPTAAPEGGAPAAADAAGAPAR